ncbi:MAG: hypothetical protein KAR39_09725 [Thermoplasmata archaeon]|nr:hypothetical protein [Thermoplasmata archaeon]
MAFSGAIVILSILVASFFILTLDEEDPPPGSPWPPNVVGPTATNVNLGRFVSDLKPTDLKVFLERNETHYGVYRFQSNDDDVLIFESGTDIAAIHYVDLADNQHINVGDQLKISNLYPDSDYVLKLIWSPTNDVVDTKKFSTPA